MSQLKNDSWTPPDPGLYHEEYTECELGEETQASLGDFRGELVQNFYGTYGEELISFVRNIFFENEADGEVTIDTAEVDQGKRTSCCKPNLQSRIVIISC